MDFLYFLQELRNPVLNAIFTAITYLGDEIFVIGILCIAYWCLDKKLAFKLCFTYFISGLTIQGLKIAFRTERPWIRDLRLKPVDSAVSGATGYSFPSGHTQGITGLFATIAFHLKKVWGFIAGFIIIALVMLSRMYLGCHTPEDVLVSFAVTFVISAAVCYVVDHFKSTNTSRIVIFILIECICAGLIAYSLYVTSSGKSTTVLAMDCFKAAGAGIGFGIGWFIEESFIKFDPKSTKKIWFQILKFVLGIAGALIIKQGLKIIFGDNITVNIIRYAICVLWIVAIYPLIVKALTNKNK